MESDYKRFRQPSQGEEFPSEYDVPSDLIGDAISRDIAPVVVMTLDLSTAGTKTISIPGRGFVPYFFLTNSTNDARQPAGLISVAVNNDGSQLSQVLQAKHNRGYRGSFATLTLSWLAQANTSVRFVIHRSKHTPWMTDDATVSSVSVVTIPQNVFVSKQGSDTNSGVLSAPFLTVAAAMASITDAIATKPYVIQVGPGVFTEAALTVKPWVSINGSGAPLTSICVALGASINVQITGNTSVKLSNFSTGSDNTNTVGAAPSKISVTGTTAVGAITSLIELNRLMLRNGFAWPNMGTVGSDSLVMSDCVVQGNVDLLSCNTVVDLRSVDMSDASCQLTVGSSAGGNPSFYITASLIYSLIVDGNTHVGNPVCIFSNSQIVNQLTLNGVGVRMQLLSVLALPTPSWTYLNGATSANAFYWTLDFQSARYQQSNTSCANNAFTVVNYVGQDYDTDNAVTTGAGWHFKMRWGGKLSVKAKVTFAATTSVGQFKLAVYVNGVIYTYLDERFKDSASSRTQMLEGSDDIVIAAGDLVDIRAWQNTGGALLLNNVVEENNVALAMTGNL